ncbi:MAG: zf-HC2 domain-containing protein [Betaproteobacteria bacterium]|nr:zf-HC2 domain-containing protein [Betaproteobacteria bacterium]
MLSCKEATRLMSQAQDRNLGLAERVQLEMHLAICKGCRNFSEQMAFLRKACRAWLDRERRLRDGES